MKIGISLPVRELKDDLGAIKAFAQTAEGLGLTHLRVPDQVLRPMSGHLHEPMMLLAYLAAVTERIELVPSIIVTPSRQTVLLAKQAAELDVLSSGRLRLGIGVGGSKAEYAALGMDFTTRGRRIEEQIELLRRLWTEDQVTFSGRWDSLDNAAGLDPLPIQRPIPLWIGASGSPRPNVRKRIGRQADGWFVLCSPEEFVAIDGDIRSAADDAGRSPSAIGTEAGVAVVGPRQAEWQDRVRGWRELGLTHLCLRTLGGDLSTDQHLTEMQRVVAQLPDL